MTNTTAMMSKDICREKTKMRQAAATVDGAMAQRGNRAHMRAQ